MVILGFMLNYMLRVNLTIAIVAMVIPGEAAHSSNASLENTGQCGAPPYTESIHVYLSDDRSINGTTAVEGRTMRDEGQTGHYESSPGNINATNNGSTLPNFPPHRVCLECKLLFFFYLHINKHCSAVQSCDRSSEW